MNIFISMVKYYSKLMVLCKKLENMLAYNTPNDGLPY